MINTTATDHIQNEDFKKAYYYAIRLLTKRDYSQHKMTEKLFSQKFEQEIVDQVIKTIIEKNFLQEDAYAKARIKSLMQRGYSPEVIQLKLNEEKVIYEYSAIDEVFKEYKTCPKIQIRELLEKKLRSKTNADIVDFNFRKKLLRYIISKGHDLDLANREIEKIIRSNADEEPL